MRSLLKWLQTVDRYGDSPMVYVGFGLTIVCMVLLLCSYRGH